MGVVIVWKLVITLVPKPGELGDDEPKPEEIDTGTDELESELVEDAPPNPLGPPDPEERTPVLAPVDCEPAPVAEPLPLPLSPKTSPVADESSEPVLSEGLDEFAPVGEPRLPELEPVAPGNPEGEPAPPAVELSSSSQSSSSPVPVGLDAESVSVGEEASLLHEESAPPSQLPESPLPCPWPLPFALPKLMPAPLPENMLQKDHVSMPPLLLPLSSPPWLPPMNGKGKKPPWGLWWGPPVCEAPQPVLQPVPVLVEVESPAMGEPAKGDVELAPAVAVTESLAPGNPVGPDAPSGLLVELEDRSSRPPAVGGPTAALLEESPPPVGGPEGAVDEPLPLRESEESDCGF